MARSPHVEVTEGLGAGGGQENWLCLLCGVVLCGRYKSLHMVKHWEATKREEMKSESEGVEKSEIARSGHSIVMSLRDGTFWCYECDCYLECNYFPPLQPLYAEFHRRCVRFGCSTVQCSKQASNVGRFPSFSL